MSFRDWLRRKAAEFAGEYYEGPDMPARYLEAVVAFANDHPRTTREQWVAFAQEWCRRTYTAGWQRGYEHVEREPYEDPSVPPELMADMRDPDWRWRSAIVLENGTMRVLSVEEFEDKHPVDPLVEVDQLVERLTRGGPNGGRD